MLYSFLFIIIYHVSHSALGHYIFIETSTPRRPNDTARIESPEVPPKATAQCVRFWYHMYGPDVNTLNVYAKVGSTLGIPVWSRTGTANNVWHFQAVDVTTTGGSVFKVSSSSPEKKTTTKKQNQIVFWLSLRRQDIGSHFHRTFENRDQEPTLIFMLLYLMPVKGIFSLICGL